MNTPLRVLIIEDSEDDTILILRQLRRAGYAPTHLRVDSEKEMAAALEKEAWDLVLCDHGLPTFNAFKGLQVLKERGLDIPFIIVSGTIGEDLAVAAMKSGAHDYLVKSHLGRLAAAVDRELGEVKVRQARKEAEDTRNRLNAELEEAYRQMELRLREVTASIMFTDLESSTELLTLLGDDKYQLLLEAHNSVIREQVADFGGLEVKTTGDGFMLVFYSTRKAALCATGIQGSLQEFNRKHPDHQLRVRIGINIGEAIHDGGDYFGSAVVLAARIMDQAGGGKILVSDIFRRLAGDVPGLQFIDCGRRQLQGFEEETHLYEVDWMPQAGPFDTPPETRRVSSPPTP